MFDGFEHKVVNVAGTEIACTFGGSGPPLLMLHGFPQNLAMWARVAPTLAAHFTVVCADLRGYGDSAKPKCLPDRSNYAFRAFADDQVGLMHRLGFQRFHVVGHDRGGRTGHRMALDHPDVVLTLTVMDIVPTYAMFMDANRHVAGAYWHWYFLSQPEPFPERLIGNDADFFYETCLIGWGATKIGDFDADMLAAYRRAWRDPAMIHGSCSDYRAAASMISNMMRPISTVKSPVRRWCFMAHQARWRASSTLRPNGASAARASSKRACQGGISSSISFPPRLRAFCLGS